MNSESRIDLDKAENVEGIEHAETAASLDSENADMSEENQATEERPNAEQSRRYSSEEVADIIRISLRDEARRADDTVDYKELLAIAAEMGVDKDQIARAVHLLEEEQLAHDKESELWVRFKTHGFLFIAVNLLCVTINVLGNSSTFWSMYVLFGWGLFLLGHYAGLRYAPQFVEIAMDRTRQLANNHYQALFEDDANIGFTSSDSTGMSETQGLVTLEGDKLILEYQTMDAFLGLLKSGIKVVEIPLQDLSNIRLEQRLWNADLVLQGKNMRVFKNAPGASAGKLRLRINRPSARSASGLVQTARETMDSSV